MARPKSPEGRRVTMAMRLSEAEAAVINEARGAADRSEWLRAVSVAAARAELGERVRLPSVSVNGLAAEAAKQDVRPVSVNGNDASPEPPCKHPADYVDAGYCRKCGAEVW